MLRLKILAALGKEPVQRKPQGMTHFGGPNLGTAYYVSKFAIPLHSYDELAALLEAAFDTAARPKYVSHAGRNRFAHASKVTRLKPH